MIAYRPVTQMQDLAKHYEVQTDDQLLQLEQQSEQLTPEAREQLLRELQKRRISAKPRNDLRKGEHGSEPSERVAVLFPSLRGCVATLQEWRQFKRLTGKWPVLSMAFHLVHGVWLLWWAGFLIWLGASYGWSVWKVSLIIVPLLLIDLVLENWIEGRIRLAELRGYRRRHNPHTAE